MHDELTNQPNEPSITLRITLRSDLTLSEREEIAKWILASHQDITLGITFRADIANNLIVLATGEIHKPGKGNP